MSIPTKAEAQKILRPYEASIRQVILEAWQECQKLQSFRSKEGWGRPIYSRTVSNEMFDAIARRALPVFGAEPRVALKVEAQTFKIFFGGKLVARFKKGGGDKLGRNIPTQEAMSFMSADGHIPGLPPETARVEIIWLANEIKTKIDHILVVARDGNSLVWEYDIGPAESDAKTTRFPEPTGPIPDNSDLVKPKRIAPSKKRQG